MSGQGGSIANKGIHAEVSLVEDRRCFLRTVLLLDDIASFRAASFEHRVRIDQEVIKNFIRHDGSA
jgi:hypothetical protein